MCIYIYIRTYIDTYKIDRYRYPHIHKCSWLVLGLELYCGRKKVRRTPACFQKGDSNFITVTLTQYSSQLDRLIEVTQQQIRQNLLIKRVTVRHREDKSFDLLDLSCVKAFCGVAEYRKVRFTWPGQRSILYPVLKLHYFNVLEE